jgi:hypothetical protein
MSSLKEKVEQLPVSLQQEVMDFVEFLMEKKVKKAGKRPGFGWAGALKDLRDRYDSVQLQHNMPSPRSMIFRS